MSAPETATRYIREQHIPDRWEAFDNAHSIISPDSLKKYGFEGYSLFTPLENVPHVWVRENAPRIIGKPFVVFWSGPSSVGKDAVKNGIRKICPSLICPVVTYTDRAIRVDKNEINGVDYHFISVKDFDEKIQNNFFFEWAHIHHKEHRSGFPESAITDAISCGLPFFRMTYDGIQTVRNKIENLLSMPTVSIGLLPETTLAKYASDLSERRQGEEILKRFENAKIEMEQMGASEFKTDYIIGNPPDPSGVPNEAIFTLHTLLHSLLGKPHDEAVDSFPSIGL